ncbi:hypothetical protein B0H19DRAFT_1266152 [Mycena capillaripes]|nr:hypothetical protein B0H19DRAFT_1266152 [Mycena capillaripes]
MSPTASPPSFFPAPYRIPDQPSPTKRQRRSSATPDDINSEREASARRMFDVWSQLAEKYSRRIDQDDIVDLVTGEIVEDRGVLSSETPWKFPRFADESVDNGTGTDEEDEDDIDELDAFSAPPEVSSQGWTVPPVRTMDPADAKDLEEFMEAERRRREEFGDEDVNEDEEEVESAGTEFCQDAPDTVSPSHRQELEDSESDDELGNWDVADESNTVHPVGAVENTETTEILDSPLGSPFDLTTPTPPPPKLTPDRKPPPRFQLHTPPQSRTPSILEEFNPVAPPSSPPKPRPNATPMHAVSQLLIRSQSRAKSSRQKDETRESHPRLDLTEITRGRSVYKHSARSSVARYSESLREPRASTNATVSSNLKRSRLKFKSEMSPKPPAFKEEDDLLSRSQDSASQSTRKRKRKSLSLDSKETGVSTHDFEWSGSSNSSPVKHSTRSSSRSAKFNSERAAEDASDSDSHSDPESPISSHHHPRLAAIRPYYLPPPFYPYPPYPPSTDVHRAMPLQEHAQFIISQAMLQLSTLLTAARPVYPPRNSSSAASTSGTSPYFHPTTPHRPHTHPYSFGSGASVGTLPPSSPPGSSPASSPIRNDSGRRASLVPRSRSRGRRVNFKVDDDLRDDQVHSHDRHETTEPDESSGPSVKKKDKGKEKVAVTNRSSSTTRKSKRNQ